MREPIIMKAGETAIGIIGAMPSELADIRAALDKEDLGEIHRFQGGDVHLNRYKGKVILTACCGVGKVNAALCAQRLIDSYPITAIINTGVAGGMNPDVKVGDIVIGAEAVQHDLDAVWLKDYPPHKAVFRADERLVQEMESSCKEHGIRSFRGRIISGDAFITDNAVKAQLADAFSPYAVDMESAAVGQACYMSGVPYISVRCISDNADDEGAMSFEEFQKMAAKRVADVVLTAIVQIP